MRNAWAWAWVVGAVVCGCGKEPVRQDSPPVAPDPPAKVAELDQADAEAEDVAQVMRVYWPLGVSAAAADEEREACQEKTPGYVTAMERCFNPAYVKTFEAWKKMPKAPMAKLACAKELEARSRSYLSTQMDYLDDDNKWVMKTGAEHPAVMAAASLPAVCRKLGALCASRPSPGDEKYRRAYGPSEILRVECTKTLFVCGKSDNVCWPNKVAGHLGLEPEDHPNLPLTVRKTGHAVR